MKYNKIVILSVLSMLALFLFSCYQGVGAGKQTDNNNNNNVLPKVAAESGITIDYSEESAIIPVGMTFRLTATVKKVLLDQVDTSDSVTWSSDKPDVASVDPSSGYVTANKLGDAVITAKSKSGQTDTFSARVRGLEISIPTDDDQKAKGGDFDIRKGETIELVAILEPYHEHLSNNLVSWEVTGADTQLTKGEIDTPTLLKALSTAADGESIGIKVSYNDMPSLTTSDTVKVAASTTAATYLAINAGGADAKVMAANETFPITASLMSAEGILQEINLSDITWDSTDPAIATVDSTNGKITCGNNYGDTTITAEYTDGLDNLLSAVFKVHVRGLQINTLTDTLNLGLLSDVLSGLNLDSVLGKQGLLNSGGLLDLGGLVGGLLDTVLGTVGHLVTGLGVTDLLLALKLDSVVELVDSLGIDVLNDQFNIDYPDGLECTGTLDLTGNLLGGLGGLVTDVVWTVGKVLDPVTGLVVDDVVGGLVPTVVDGVLSVTGTLQSLDIEDLGNVIVTAAIPGTEISTDKTINLRSLLDQ